MRCFRFDGSETYFHRGATVFSRDAAGHWRRQGADRAWHRVRVDYDTWLRLQPLSPAQARRLPARSSPAPAARTD